MNMKLALAACLGGFMVTVQASAAAEVKVPLSTRAVVRRNTRNFVRMISLLHCLTSADPTSRKAGSCEKTILEVN